MLHGLRMVCALALFRLIATFGSRWGGVAPCVLHAFRLFERKQFLFLRYEELFGWSVRDLLEHVSAATGLHVDDAVIAAAERSGKCSFARSTKRPMAFSANSSAKSFAELPPHYATFFAPYERFLKQLTTLST